MLKAWDESFAQIAKKQKLLLPLRIRWYTGNQNCNSTTICIICDVACEHIFKNLHASRACAGFDSTKSNKVDVITHKNILIHPQRAVMTPSVSKRECMRSSQLLGPTVYSHSHFCLTSYFAARWRERICDSQSFCSRFSACWHQALPLCRLSNRASSSCRHRLRTLVCGVKTTTTTSLITRSIKEMWTGTQNGKRS